MKTVIVKDICFKILIKKKIRKKIHGYTIKLASFS